MMSAKKTYNEHMNELKKVYAEDYNWEILKDRQDVTLLLGSGVTSCLVGNWNELLNELAVLRSVSEDSDVTPQNMLDYLEKSCNNKFLPDEINTLEKGEYLRFCITDQQLFKTKEKDEKWREVIFAARVDSAVQRLIRRHLRDGAGLETEKNYKTDFLKWCNNSLVTPFSIGRRVLSDNKETELALDIYSSEDIANKLNSYYKISINYTILENLIDIGINKENDIFKMFESLYKGRSSKSFRKKINKVLNNDDIKGKDKSEKIRYFLKKIAAYLLWRPGYGTLETVLSLCINNKVKNVITYNFDTIFDRLLIDEDIQRVLQKCKDPYAKRYVKVYDIGTYEPLEWIGCGKKDYPNSIHVHHVHGIVDNEMKNPKPIIFSETSYLSYQHLALNLGSIQIADAYFKGSLLCIGFSGVDPNFRGIIRQMNLLKNAPVFNDSKDHYIFLTKSLEDITNYYSITEDMPETDCTLAFRCTKTYLEMLKYYYKNEVEVSILWASEYKEMAEKLKAVFDL